MLVVVDPIGGLTSVCMLAEVIALILAQGREDVFGYLNEKGGLYHCAGGGSCSRFEWAKAILDLDPHKEEQIVKVLETVKSTKFPTPAQRPLVSVMNCTSLEGIFGVKLPSWQISLGL
jgi:dTDP-4-dehydrorhamnose reductase